MLSRTRFLAASSSAVVATGLPSLASAIEEVTIPVAGGNLYGTLVYPASTLRSPAVLIIAGSGPTDRDGNNPITGKNDAYKKIAATLASVGIASLRYDKRGIAASSALRGKQSDLRFDMYIDDAVALIAYLRRNDKVTDITVVGHSEGSLIGMIAAQRAKAAAFVSLAGAGRPAETILLEQYGKQISAADLVTLKGVLDRIAAGESVTDAPAQFRAVTDPSLQPYIRSWFMYDPAVEIAKLRSRIAIVQGMTDLQVSESDARLLARAAPSARLVLVPHMNHVLKYTDATTIAEQLPVYGDPSLPVNPLVTDTIARAAIGT